MVQQYDLDKPISHMEEVQQPIPLAQRPYIPHGMPGVMYVGLSFLFLSKVMKSINHS